MRKSFLITIVILLFFFIEFFLFNMAGRWFMPNLLLLAIIYFNLAFGIRYSIFAAVLAGILRDSFSTGLFGLNIFAFFICAYMSTFLKRYLHYVASRRSRLLLVFVVTAIHVAVLLCFQMMFRSVEIAHVFRYVFIPEISTTLIVASFIFARLRKCVLKYFA